MLVLGNKLQYFEALRECSHLVSPMVTKLVCCKMVKYLDFDNLILLMLSLLRILMHSNNKTTKTNSTIKRYKYAINYQINWLGKYNSAVSGSS